MKARFLTEMTANGRILLIPRRFKSYEVIETIAKGGSSVVVAVHCVYSNYTFAAKVIPRPQGKNESIKQVERELRLSMQMASPFLIGCRDVVYLDDIIVVVMERSDGRNMVDAINDSTRLVRYHGQMMFRHICSGVHYLHKKGIAHRDLKPENVLVDRNYNCRLCDYGLVCETTNGAISLSICGTVPYKSPEQIRGGGYCAMAADVWALGVLLFVIQAGRLPWNSESDMGMSREILNGEIDMSWMSEEVRQVVASCCEVDPEKRATIDMIMEMPFLRNSGDVNRGIDSVNVEQKKVCNVLPRKVIVRPGIDLVGLRLGGLRLQNQRIYHSGRT